MIIAVISSFLGGSMTTAHPPFVSNFFLCSVDNNGKDSKACILYKYNHKDMPIVPNVEQFAFPDEKIVFEVKLSIRHIFVLTDAEGRRIYGYCYRFRCNDPSNTLPAKPYCLCILSYQDNNWKQPFHELLACLSKIIFSPESTLLSSSPLSKRFHAASKIIEMINQNYKPTLGRNVRFQIQAGLIGTEKKQTDLVLTAPKTDYTCKGYVTARYDGLAKCLQSSSRFIFLFIAMLLEKRVIFTSSNLEYLSDCIFSAIQMLQPFSWQYVFVPIVPESLLNYCTAPMPFLMGVHSIHLPAVKLMPVDDILYVDLDNGTLKGSSILQQHVREIPVKWCDQLKEDLDNALATYRGGRTTVDNVGMAQAFLKFLFVLMYEYQNFYQTDPVTGSVTFDQHEFIASQTRESKNVCERLCETQLFHSYTYSVAQDKQSLGGAQQQFEKDLFHYVCTHPRGLVEQLSIGFSSVFTKYKQSMNQMTNNRNPQPRPIATPERKSVQPAAPKISKKAAMPDARFSDAPFVTAKMLANLPAPPSHKLNATWNTDPEKVSFGCLHDLFSPHCNRQDNGVLLHFAKTLPLIEFVFDDHASLPSTPPRQELVNSAGSLLDSPNPMRHGDLLSEMGPMGPPPSLPPRNHGPLPSSSTFQTQTFSMPSLPHSNLLPPISSFPQPEPLPGFLFPTVPTSSPQTPSISFKSGSLIDFPSVPDNK